MKERTAMNEDVKQRVENYSKAFKQAWKDTYQHNSLSHRFTVAAFPGGVTMFNEVVWPDDAEDIFLGKFPSAYDAMKAIRRDDRFLPDEYKTMFEQAAKDQKWPEDKTVIFPIPGGNFYIFASDTETGLGEKESREAVKYIDSYGSEILRKSLNR